MASVYKSLASGSSDQKDHDEESAAINRQRVLILSSRGVTYRHRHLLNDLHALLPHSRKDAKLDTKTKLYQLNELADLHNCNNILFFEARKAKDLYVWISKPPNGPTIKFHAHNLHTMSELHFPGNCLRGSRPILSFDASFESQPHLRLVKELLTHVFAVPRTSRRIKPFIDHVLGFTLADGRVWLRCYQISETEAAAQSEGSEPGTNANTDSSNGKPSSAGPGSEPVVVNGQASLNSTSGGRDTRLSLTEIGPRIVLTPIVVLEGSFGGPVIYENREFVSPNQVRAAQRVKKASRHLARAERGLDGRVRRRDLGLRSGEGKPRRRDGDDLDDRVLFA